MKNSVLNTRLIEIISSLLILLFVYTGISKLNEQDNFRAVLSESPLIESKANFISWLLPITELIAASLLLLPTTRKWGFMISILLMSLFTAYIAYMIFFTPYLPCSCGGVMKQMTWSQHLWFNILFTALTVFGYWLYQKNKLFIAINRISRKPV